MPQRETCVDDNRRVKIDRRNCTVHYLYASGRKRLFQNGQGDNNVQTVGEAPSRLRKSIFLIKTHTYLKIVQYNDSKTDPATSHINTFSRVLSKISSEGINFKEELKSLALLSSLPASWEVICMTFANSCPKLNLDEMIGQVLLEDIRQKSM